MGSSMERRPCTGHSQSSDSQAEEQINIYCKIIKTVAMKVKRSATIKSLKVRLRKKVHISENLQELFFAGERLKDGQTIVHCGINKDSTLHLFIHSLAAIRVFVEIPSKQEIIMLEVKPCDTIQNIKTMIQAKEEIQSDQFSLYSAGKKLNDDSTLAYLNIKTGSTLHLVFNPRDVLSICVKTQSGSIKRLKVRLLHTVEDIKAILGSMTGVPVSDFRLSYVGKKLEGCKTLAYYDIKEKSLLEILPPLIKIFIRTCAGVTVTLNVEPEDTVGDLMDKIFQNTRYPVDCQMIIYDGKELEEGQDLASYGIQQNSTLRVILRSNRKTRAEFNF